MRGPKDKGSDMRCLFRWLAVVGAITLAIDTLGPACAQAQEADMAYGQGVHAYFSGRSAQAELTMAKPMNAPPRN